MRTRILTQALVILMIGIASPAPAQAPAQPTNAGPVQPWGLPPLPAGVGPVEKFADIHDTPAVIDCRRRLAAQRDPVVANNIDAHEWVLLIGPAAVPP